MKIVRVEHEGRLYNTIFRDDGRGLTEEELFILAIRTPLPDPTRVRHLSCVCLTEEIPRHHPDFVPDIANGHFIVLDRASLILGGTTFEIGECESFSRKKPGETEGIDVWHLTATFYLHNSKLSEVIWNAINDGLFDGVCAAVTYVKPLPPATRSVDGIIDEVRVGMLSDSAFPSAKIIKSWEEPQTGKRILRWWERLPIR